LSKQDQDIVDLGHPEPAHMKPHLLLKLRTLHSTRVAQPQPLSAKQWISRKITVINVNVTTSNLSEGATADMSKYFPDSEYPEKTWYDARTNGQCKKRLQHHNPEPRRSVADIDEPMANHSTCWLEKHSRKKRHHHATLRHNGINVPNIPGATITPVTITTIQTLQRAHRAALGTGQGTSSELGARGNARATYKGYDCRTHHGLPGATTLFREQPNQDPEQLNWFCGFCPRRLTEDTTARRKIQTDQNRLDFDDILCHCQCPLQRGLRFMTISPHSVTIMRNTLYHVDPALSHPSNGLTLSQAIRLVNEGQTTCSYRKLVQDEIFVLEIARWRAAPLRTQEPDHTNSFHAFLHAQAEDHETIPEYTGHWRNFFALGIEMNFKPVGSINATQEPEIHKFRVPNHMAARYLPLESFNIIMNEHGTQITPRVKNVLRLVTPTTPKYYLSLP
jgi:hypothetical protein